MKANALLGAVAAILVAASTVTLTGCKDKDEEEPNLLCYDQFIIPDKNNIKIPVEGGNVLVTWSANWSDLIVTEHPGAYIEYVQGYDVNHNIIDSVPWTIVPEWEKGFTPSTEWIADTLKGEWFSIIKKDAENIYWRDKDFNLVKVRISNLMQIVVEPNTTNAGRGLSIHPDGIMWTSLKLAQDSIANQP